MSTTQAQRPQQTQAKCKNWEAIFPNEQVTEQRSALFVKKLLAVAISNITYLRNIFPENAFGDKCLEDLNLKILRDESSCPGACQVIKWVKGCFDALDKKYLKTLIIGIYVDPNNPETVIESYTFKFSYQNDGSVDIYRNGKKIADSFTAEETKKATIKLLRTLIVLTNTLSPLPDNVMMTMKLLYHDEVTPSDYEPPGFKAATDDPFAFNDDAANIAVGSVSTSFHTVKLRVKTASAQFVNQDILADNEQNSDKENEPVNEISCEQDVSNADSSSTKEKGSAEESMIDTESKEDDFKVRCPCGCNEDDGLMIMCGNCKFWQHGVCFLVTNEDKAPTDHICDICAKPGAGDNNLRPTDPTLCEMTSITVQATCLWRRLLIVCTEFNRIVAPDLAKRLGIENTVAQGLINRLEKEGFVSKSGRGKKIGKVVNKTKVQSEGIPTYLRTPRALRNSRMKLADNNIDVDESPVKLADKSIDKDINALTDGAKNMSLAGKRAKRQSPAPPKPVENKVTPSRKRVYSKSNLCNDDFELANSQETPAGGPGTGQKASKVSKDILV